jgi:hypothetical protein
MYSVQELAYTKLEIFTIVVRRHAFFPFFDEGWIFAAQE